MADRVIKSVCEKQFRTFSGRSKHYKKCSEAKACEKVTKSEICNGKYKSNICKKLISQLSNMYRHLNDMKSRKLKKLRKIKTSVALFVQKTFQRKVN